MNRSHPRDKSCCMIFVKGPCTGNPGPGTYAAMLVSADGTISTVIGSAPATTNNQMELTAAIEAIESIPDGAHATVMSDSQYLIVGMNKWIANWKANGWRSSKRKPVENADLWERCDRAASSRTILWAHGGQLLYWVEMGVVTRLAQEARQEPHTPPRLTIVSNDKMNRRSVSEKADAGHVLPAKAA